MQNQSNTGVVDSSIFTYTYVVNFTNYYITDYKVFETLMKNNFLIFE
ncbi:MAG: hypothetical protein ACXWCZ_06215 [Flavisolibacter sp.]